MNRYFLLCIVLACGQVQAQKYMGQKPPGKTPEVFAPGVISMENEYEFGSVFNKDGTEFYYAVNVNRIAQIRYSRLDGSEWTEPIVLLSNPKFGINDPFLSRDEDRLYFISDGDLVTGDGDTKDYDIWYVEKEGKSWSDPINAGPNINSSGNEYYISFNAEGAMYFGSNKDAAPNEHYNLDIYTSPFKNGNFQKAERLDENINTKSYEADVFIDPDETYIIFCADREEGLGQGDLYISFKDEDGNWTPSKNMGDLINTPMHELCPFVTRDGKYFFYTSHMDIYWVDASIIHDMNPNK